MQSSPGGIGAKAIAGIELALVEIAARARGLLRSAELFGGPLRHERARLLVPLRHKPHPLPTS